MKKIFVVSLCLSVSAIGLAEQIHTVRKGETLWGISGNYLDDPFSWVQIYQANLDRIEDPHWIFPGQKFIVPDVVYQRASAEMEISSFRTSRSLAEKTGVAKEELPTPATTQKASSLLPKERVDLWEKEVPVVSSALVYRAGYITRELPQWGKIINAEDTGPREILTHHKILVDKGAKDLVMEGQLFTVLRIGKGVKHPREGKYLGKIVHILGTIRAISVEEESFRALVEACFEPLRLGDIVVAFDKVDAPVTEGLLETRRQLHGVIVAGLTNEPKFLPSDIAYVDKGRDDDISPGDIFEIYREGRKVRGVVEPIEVIGELQILRVKDETSSAVINSIDNKLDLRVGELVRLKKEAI